MAPFAREINENEHKNNFDTVIMDLTFQLRQFLETYETTSENEEDDDIFVYPEDGHIHLNLQNEAYMNISEYDDNTDESEYEYEDGFLNMDADIQDRALRNIPDTEDEYESEDEYEYYREDEDQYSKINLRVQDEVARNVREY